MQLFDIHFILHVNSTYLIYVIPNIKVTTFIDVLPSRMFVLITMQPVKSYNELLDICNIYSASYHLTLPV